MPVTTFVRRQVNRTADYVIKPANDRSGTVFTNAGATAAVNFTLPVPNQAVQGFEYDFLGLADQNITVTAPTADTLVGINDLAADSVALSTASQKIGGRIRAVCVRTNAVTVNPPTYQWAVTNEAVGAAGTLAT